MQGLAIWKNLRYLIYGVRNTDWTPAWKRLKGNLKLQIANGFLNAVSYRLNGHTNTLPFICMLKDEMDSLLINGKKLDFANVCTKAQCGNFMIFLSLRFYVKSRSSKTAVFGNFGAFNLVNLVNFSLQKVQKCIKIQRL